MNSTSLESRWRSFPAHPGQRWPLLHPRSSPSSPSKLPSDFSHIDSAHDLCSNYMCFCVTTSPLLFTRVFPLFTMIVRNSYITIVLCLFAGLSQKLNSARHHQLDFQANLGSRIVKSNIFWPSYKSKLLCSNSSWAIKLTTNVSYERKLTKFLPMKLRESWVLSLDKPYASPTVYF